MGDVGRLGNEIFQIEISQKININRMAQMSGSTCPIKPVGRLRDLGVVKVNFLKTAESCLKKAQLAKCISAAIC